MEVLTSHKQRILALAEKIDSLNEEFRSNGSVGKPPSIGFLEDLLKGASDKDEIHLLMVNLELEYARYKMEEEEEKIIYEFTTKFEDDPMPWISLASHLMYKKNDLEEARRVVEISIAKAFETGSLIRHAHNTRARIALALKDYGLLEETLKFLTDFVPTRGRDDIGPERDFLVKLPQGVVDAEVLQRFEDDYRRRMGLD